MAGEYEWRWAVCLDDGGRVTEWFTDPEEAIRRLERDVFDASEYEVKGRYREKSYWVLADRERVEFQERLAKSVERNTSILERLRGGGEDQHGDH